MRPYFYIARSPRKGHREVLGGKIKSAHADSALIRNWQFWRDSLPLRLCKTPTSPPNPDQIGIKNCKQIFSQVLAFITNKDNTCSGEDVRTIRCYFFYNHECKQLWKKVFTVFDANRDILHTLKELIWDIEKYEYVLTY